MSKEKTLSPTDEHLASTDCIAQIGIFQFEANSNSIDWNNALREIHEVPQDYIPNTENIYGCCKDLESRNRLLEAHKQAIEDGTPFELDYEIITAKGNFRNLRTSVQPFQRSEDCITLYGATLDITETNSTKSDLVQKVQQLNYAEKIAKSGSWDWDIPANILKWSDNVYEIFEHERDSPISFDVYLNYVHQDDKEKIVSKFDHALKTTEFPESNYRIQLKNGVIKTLRSIGMVITNENGEPIKMIGTCQDITDREKKEKELLEKNQQLNIAEKLAMIGYWQWDTPTNKVFWSDNLHVIYGHNKDQPLTFETYINFVHEDDRNRVISNLENAMQTGVFPESTYRIQLNDGSIKTIKTVGKIIRNKKGEVLEMSGTCQDVTEIKKNELQLLEKNQQYNNAEKIANIGSWEWNPNNGEMNWSDNHYRIYGIEVGSPIDIELISSYIHPDDISFTEDLKKRILKGKKFEKAQYRIQLNSGEIKTLEVVGEVFTDKDGEITSLKGIEQDITYRVKTEQQIKDKNHLLSFTEKMAMMGSWQWNPNTGASKWSDNLYKIYDLDPNRPIDMELFLSRIHPEDSAEVVTQIENIIATKNSDSILSYRIIMNNGDIRSIELMAEIISDNEENIIELVGTTQDVTYRLQREQDLLEKNQLLNFAEQLSSIGHWKWDIVNDIMEKSVNLLKILDFDPDTSPSFSTYLKRVHPEDREKVIAVSQEISKTKKFNKFQHRIIKDNGKVRTIEIIGAVLLNNDGNVVELMGSSQDITEQVEAQQKILETNKSLEASAAVLTSKNQQLAEFNHITSHNLRSPVSNLNALLGMYKNATSENKKIEIFEKFEIVIDHLTETLNALIETITIKHNAVHKRQELSFEHTLHKTKEILAAELIETGALIDYKFSKAENVMYNPIYLESIFLNLVSNSIKYRSPDRRAKICITSKVVNQKTIIEFKDNGIGIDMKSHGDKLFGLNKVFHKHPEAKGVGLFLTKAQIVAMGGSISVESEVNVGSTFIITLN
ncbi:hypothetical protein LCGC14_0051730 [marine sediment metagenome]|uniref:histidine kinase n=1 Tax=marine sediment metagenome TaxID=412755 RepID=A0A0F9VRW8_9ZZZZ|nr:PAS domain-containing protein [Maribacter sp.]HDZ06981.1 PAS domain S-box protein [Maribacter sp.]HEA80468.1 PAS domain S-box protein [Maribacter sp.]